MEKKTLTPVERAIRNGEGAIRRLEEEEKTEKARHARAMREIARKIGARRQVLNKLKG